MAASSAAASIARPATHKRRDPARNLETERDRRRGLEERPAEHDGAGVAIGQLPKLALETSVVGSEDRARTVNREDHRRIRDVLTRRAEVHVPGAGGVGRAHARGQRLHQRNRNRPRRARLPGDRRGVESHRRWQRPQSTAAALAGITPAFASARASAASKSSIACRSERSEKILGQRVGRRQTVDQT